MNSSETPPSFAPERFGEWHVLLGFRLAPHCAGLRWGIFACEKVPSLPSELSG